MNHEAIDIASLCTPGRIAALERLLQTLSLAPDGHAAEIDAIGAAISALNGIDESDRIAGLAMRRAQAMAAREHALQSWMDTVKREAGFAPDVSFEAAWYDLAARPEAEPRAVHIETPDPDDVNDHRYVDEEDTHAGATPAAHAATGAILIDPSNRQEF